LTGQCKFDGNLLCFSPTHKKKKPHPHCTHWQSPTSQPSIQSFTKECNFANLLTVLPDAFKDEKYIQLMRSENISKREILDATLVVVYFNFVKRIVLELGMEISEAKMQGYNY
jgi:hypothetical protein